MVTIKSPNCRLFYSAVSVVLMLLLACSGLSKKSSVPVKSPPGTETTFILVRHAERANGQGQSALKPEGRERARALVDARGDKGVTAIYSPDRGRKTGF